MANINLIVPKILKWEGGFGFHPADPGGATNRGITIATFRSVFGKDKTVEDLRAMTTEQWMQVLKLLFWDKWKADEIKSQSIAEILVDWVWASGKYGFEEPQKLLGVQADGKVGPKTLAAINEYPDQPGLHRKIYDARMKFIERIVAYNINEYKTKGFPDRNIPANPSPTEQDLKKFTFVAFQKGWENRINDAYKFYQA